MSCRGASIFGSPAFKARIVEIDLIGEQRFEALPVAIVGKLPADALPLAGHPSIVLYGPDGERNATRRVFRDERYRTLFADIHQLEKLVVGISRFAQARRPPTAAVGCDQRSHQEQPFVCATMGRTSHQPSGAARHGQARRNKLIVVRGGYGEPTLITRAMNSARQRDAGRTLDVGIEPAITRNGSLRRLHGCPEPGRFRTPPSAADGLDTFEVKGAAMSIQRVVLDIESERLAESRDFYVGVLGFEVAMDMGWIMTFASPTNSTAQVSVMSRDAKATVIPDASIEVTDVNSIYIRAQQRGEFIVYPLTDEPWGVRRFFVRDPNGKVINVLSHVND